MRNSERSRSTLSLGFIGLGIVVAACGSSTTPSGGGGGQQGLMSADTQFPPTDASAPPSTVNVVWGMPLSPPELAVPPLLPEPPPLLLVPLLLVPLPLVPLLLDSLEPLPLPLGDPLLLPEELFRPCGPPPPPAGVVELPQAATTTMPRPTKPI